MALASARSSRRAPTKPGRAGDRQLQSGDQGSPSSASLVLGLLEPAEPRRAIASSKGSSPSPVAAETTNGSTPPPWPASWRAWPCSLASTRSARDQRQHLGLVLEPGAIGLELAADDAIGLDRILAGGIDQVEQHPACARHGRGSGRRSRRLRRRPRSARGCRRATNSRPLWLTTPSCGRSVVKGYSPTLATALVVRVEEGRLAGVGQADQPDVGEQLQPQPDIHFLARPAGAVLARGAVGRGLVAGVAAPAVAALEEVRCAARPR